MRERSQRLWVALSAAIGVDEIFLAVGLILLTTAVWRGPLALLIPGGVITWIALPSRRPFVDRTPPDPPKRRQA